MLASFGLRAGSCFRASAPIMTAKAIEKAARKFLA
jgi:hypothetical protein